MLVIIAKVIEAHTLISPCCPSVILSLPPSRTHIRRTERKRLVWRSLPHLSLYQAVSPSLQRRCLFEECAMVGRMNLHDERGIYLFIFHQPAPHHPPGSWNWFPLYAGHLQFLCKLKAMSLIMTVLLKLSHAAKAKICYTSAEHSNINLLCSIVKYHLAL